MLLLIRSLKMLPLPAVLINASDTYNVERYIKLNLFEYAEFVHTPIV